MKTITFAVHYVDGMNDDLYSPAIMINKPKMSMIYTFSEDEFELLGIKCISQLIHAIEAINHCLEELITKSGIENFTFQNTYVKQKDYLLSFKEDKTLDTVFKDFQTEHLELLHFFVIGGGSFECNGYRFAVHSNESIHQNAPHVHVIKDDESVRYSLDTLERMDPCSRKFRLDEKKRIIPTIRKNLERLRDYWTAAMKGYQPPEFDIENKQYYPES